MKKAVLVNYNYDPKDWWLDFGYKPEDVIIYDRSDDGIEREFKANVIRTENLGQVDFDKLNFLHDYYDVLPEYFLWAKTNLWKFITPEEWEKVAQNKDFTPILTKHHKIEPPLYGYDGDIYYECREIAQAAFNQFDWRYFRTYDEFTAAFGLKQSAERLRFAPGGNYILTRERVHRYSRDFYRDIAETLPYCREPREAQMCERCYYDLWL